MPNLVEEALMPMLFAMFGVSEVGAWNFPASQYRVDEFMFQCRSISSTNQPVLGSG
jgi:hypothetical protein